FPIRRNEAFTIVLGSTLKIWPTPRREALVHRAADAPRRDLISLVSTGVVQRRVEAEVAAAAVSATSLPTFSVVARRARKRRRGRNQNAAKTSRCRSRFLSRKRSRD